MIAPGSTIGILGGGQLGRMTALAAANLGYRVHVFTPEADSPCAQVSAAATMAAFDDEAALEAFAAQVDVVTLEWENIPVTTVNFLAHKVPVHPGGAVLAVTQDRIREKSFVNALNIATAPWREARSAGEVARARDELGGHCILKATRMGYDGKGQVKLAADADPAEAWRQMGGEVGIVEGFVDFACEVSVIVARRADGAVATYPVVENRHAHHILAETIVPASVSAETAAEADSVARRIAEALGLIGLVAVEMFVTPQGRVLVNEMAPRPHNSGHWTIDACDTSQFEQLVRAVCGLPLGSTRALGEAVMENLIGGAVGRWPDILAEPGARLHLYGKTEARPGRKMGHVTRLRRDSSTL
ncbi:MAG TPA: 5-(carboxyamino)imidazole ribonucleotide synthase [Azospirillaceae bacterium]|nr:5-(carboxyamino)imidazole ribonucleotide synthase [Azospirillaceae bacterium]